MKDEKLKAIIEAMQGITYLEWKKLRHVIEQRISLVFNVLCKELFLEPYSIKHADKITKKWDKLP